MLLHILDFENRKHTEFQFNWSISFRDINFKKIDMRIKDESVEQVDSYKYLGCNISSNLNCCQEVKQRIAMAKEAFNKKRSIFCGPLEKELRKRLVKCFAWSVALYAAETWTL